jgi:hypothetical protein
MGDSPSMKSGNWIPLDKRLVYFLPKDRPFTTLEALFSLTFNRDSKRPESISGYASRWQWDRKKVRQFIHDLDTGKDTTVKDKGHPKGHPIRLVSNNLQDEKDRHLPTISYPYSSDPINKNINGVSPEKNGATLPIPLPSKILHITPIKLKTFLKVHGGYDPEAVKVVEYFVSKYRKERHEPHPAMKPEVWHRILKTILYVYDDITEGDDLKIMIDHYFTKNFPNVNVDYRLPHFADDSIKTNLFYEVLY